MVLSNSVKHDLRWWKIHLPTSENDDFALEIFSDSSSLVWEIFFNGQSAQGWWNLEDRLEHTNYVFRTECHFLRVEMFARQLGSCNILLRIDNATALCLASS